MTRSALRIAFVVASLVALSVALAVACLALLLTPQAATAQETRQEQRQNTPGQFDFYVLSLPWSPSFCASAAERSRSGAAINAQCGARPYSFVPEIAKRRCNREQVTMPPMRGG
jgi:ribonuclease I